MQTSTFAAHLAKREKNMVRHEDKLTLAEYYIYAGVCVVLGIGIILTNTLIITAFIRSKNIRSSKTNYLGINLAVGETLIAVVCLPMWMVAEVWLEDIDQGNSTILNPKVSRSLTSIYPPCWYSLMTVCLVNLALLSTERCAVISFPLWYKAKICKRHICSAVVASWLYSSGLWVADYFWDPKSTAIRKVKVTILFTIGFCFPFTVILFSYLVLFIRAKSSQLKTYMDQTSSRRNSLHRRRRLFRLAIRLSVLTVMFLFCRIPPLLASMLADISRKVEIWLELLIYLHSLLSPLIYTFTKEDFRRRILKMLRVH